MEEFRYMAFPPTSNLDFAFSSALQELGAGRGGGVIDVSFPSLRTIWGRTRVVKASRGVSVADGDMIDLRTR